ncbi:MAG: cell division FtsA domain-containing protein [Bacteroidales bacterium]|nr:cell division FtsA domain-containing protein [Bacteroidales bacterium]
MNTDNNNIYLAVDYGASKALMMIAEKKYDGKLHIIGMEEEKMSDIIVPAHTFKAQRQRCVNRCDNVESFKLCYKGYSCQSLRSFPGKLFQVKKNIDGSFITESTLHDLDVQCISEIEANNSEYTPLAVKAVKYYVDDEETLQQPVGRICSSLRADYICVFGKRTFFTREELSENDIRLSVSPLVMAEQLLSDRDRNGCMLIDFGAKLTTMVVCFQGKIQHVATIPLGGRNITLDIANILGIPEDDAEHNKITLGNANSDVVGSENKTININGKEVEFSLEGLSQIIAARENEILDYIWRELRQLNCFDKLSEGVFITGGASQMRGLDELIAKRQVKVKHINLEQFLDTTSGISYKNPKYAHIIAQLLQATNNCAVFKPEEIPVVEPIAVPTPQEVSQNENNQGFAPELNSTIENAKTKTPPKGRGFFGGIKNSLGNLFNDQEDNE